MFQKFFKGLPEAQKETLTWLMSEFSGDFCPAKLKKIDQEFQNAKKEIDGINKRRAFIQTRLNTAESLFKYVDTFLKSVDKNEDQLSLIFFMHVLHNYKEALRIEYEESEPKQLLAKKQSCRVRKEDLYLRNLFAREMMKKISPENIEQKLESLTKKYDQSNKSETK